MSRTALSCLVLCWLLAAQLAAAGLDKRIDVDLEGAPAKDVLTSFGHVLDAEVEIVEGVEGLVTIRVEDVTVRTVMNAVCESIGCAWTLSDDGGSLRFTRVGTDVRIKEVTKLRQKFDMSLVDAPAEQILASFASILESELKLECDGVDRLVSIDVEDVELRDAIDQICSEIDCVCVIEPGVVTVR